MSWEDAWREGRTGWDAGAAAPSLIALLESDTIVHDGYGETKPNALVAGCGAGWDVFALAKHGNYRAWGMDVAPSVRERFEALRKDTFGLDEEDASITIGDFFADELPQGVPEAFDLIWDYTFFCAIEPGMRERWLELMVKRLAPGGRLVTLIFPVNPKDPSPSTEEDNGPPYRLHPSWIMRMFAPHLELDRMERVRSSHEGRQGKEWLAVWKHYDNGQGET